MIGCAGLTIKRQVYSTQNELMRFDNGATTAAVIGRPANSDDLTWGFDNGGAEVERLRLTQANGFVGIATSTPDASLQVQGSLSLKVTQSAATYTIATSTDFLVAITSTASPRSVNLPQCTATSTAPGLTDKVRYEVKDESGAAGTNNVTVTATFGQLIDGASTKVINTNYGIARVYCDGQVNGGAWFSY